MESFDEAEVQVVEVGDRDYPELLKSIRNPPKAIRIRGSLPPHRKIIAISGSRKTTQQALDAAYRIGRMLAQHGYTIVDGLASGCDTSATEGALSAGGNVIGVVPRGLKSLRGHTQKLAEKILRRVEPSFRSILTTSRKYSGGTICVATRLSRGSPKKRSLSRRKSDRDRLRLPTMLYVKDER